jgi:hypothetical protein
MEESLKRWVIDQYGADSTVAHDFGYSPPKVPAKSVDTKAQALVSTKATRAARHTMGSKQKEIPAGPQLQLAARCMQRRPPGFSQLDPAAKRVAAREFRAPVAWRARCSCTMA